MAQQTKSNNNTQIDNKDDDEVSIGNLPTPPSDVKQFCDAKNENKCKFEKTRIVINNENIVNGDLKYKSGHYERAFEQLEQKWQQVKSMKKNTCYDTRHLLQKRNQQTAKLEHLKILKANMEKTLGQQSNKKERDKQEKSVINDNEDEKEDIDVASLMDTVNGRMIFEKNEDESDYLQKRVQLAKDMKKKANDDIKHFKQKIKQQNEKLKDLETLHAKMMRLKENYEKLVEDNRRLKEKLQTNKIK